MRPVVPVLRQSLLVFLCLSLAAVCAPAQDLPLRDPFGGDLTEGLDELLQQPSSDDLEAAPVPAETAGPIDQLLGLMGQATEQLSAGVTGPPTQQVQQSIVSQLDGWLNANRPGGESGGNQSQGTQQQQTEQQPSQGAQSSESANGEATEGTGAQQESPEATGDTSGRDAADSSGDATAAAGSDSPATDSVEGGDGEGREATGGASAKPGRAGDVDPSLSGDVATAGDVWGHLPPRVRDRVRNISPEDYLPRYRKAIEEYFKRIAEQGR